jgi:hypothetical protein
MGADEEYEETVEALRRGQPLPDVRRDPPSMRPTPGVLVVASMLSMFVLLRIDEAFPSIDIVMPLAVAGTFYLLAAWGRSK